MSKLNLNFGQRKSHAVAPTTTAGHNTETVKGGGRKDFRSSVDEIVSERSPRQANRQAHREDDHPGNPATTGTTDSGKESSSSRSTPQHRPQPARRAIKVNKVVPVGGTRGTYEDLVKASCSKELMVCKR
ncbi:MAG: hypothetical protein IPI39_26035 [Candidatus Obscuribacter sp.]|nr:hypothetical protein [Candidatus Obscuribacter sp.]